MGCMFVNHPWAENARVPKTWGSRPRARYIYTWVCLPVRFIIFTSLLWLCIHLDPSPGQYRNLASLLMLVVIWIFCADDTVWWSRDYITFECVVAAFLLAINCIITTVSVLYALLMVHWICSCLKAKEWWTNKEEAELAVDHSPPD